jgi:hypothetical protein
MIDPNMVNYDTGPCYLILIIHLESHRLVRTGGRSTVRGPKKVGT